VPKVFKEKVGGAKTDRAELAKLLRRIEPGDVLIVTRLDRLARSTRDLLNVIAALADFAAGALSKTSGIAVHRAKKHPKLSADERAFLNRLDCLNEEEIKQLTTRAIFAYFKIIDKVESRADVRRMVERAK
jgi:DNA invertase Pin-like site-specific DNA recombinase